MSVLITASLGGGHLLLRNREIEHLEVISKFGEPHRCIVRFDLDTNHADALQDFHGQLSVEIAREDGSAKAVLFEGVMTGGTQDHQLRGGSRYEVRAASPLLLALEHRTEPMIRHVDWDSLQIGDRNACLICRLVHKLRGRDVNRARAIGQSWLGRVHINHRV